MRITTVFVILCVFLVATTTLAQCTIDGYNFKKYSDKELIYDDDGYKYSFIFCNKAQFNKECAEKGANSCIVNPSGTLLSIGSIWNDKEGPKLTAREDGVLLVFNNGQNTLNVDVKCSKTIDFKASPPSMGRLNYDISHPAGCAGSAGGSGGLSGGSIVLIVLACLFVVYFIGFCFYNIKFKQMPFGQACPHRSFWCALPGLFIAGVKYVISCFCGKKDSSSYEQQESYGATDV